MNSRAAYALLRQLPIADAPLKDGDRVFRLAPVTWGSIVGFFNDRRFVAILWDDETSDADILYLRTAHQVFWGEVR